MTQMTQVTQVLKQGERTVQYAAVSFAEAASTPKAAAPFRLVHEVSVDQSGLLIVRGSGEAGEWHCRLVDPATREFASLEGPVSTLRVTVYEAGTDAAVLSWSDLCATTKPVTVGGWYPSSAGGLVLITWRDGRPNADAWASDAEGVALHERL